MNKKMLIECDLHQTRIAVLEQDRLAEIFIERHHQLGVVGNIYQGRVNRVLPGMQAAFVDIGLDRDAFLYVSEVVDPLATYDEVEAREASPGHEETLPVVATSPESPNGTQADSAASHNLEFEPFPQEATEATEPKPERPSIDQLLKPGQELMVQVLKDAMPRLKSHFPGVHWSCCQTSLI